MKGAIIGKVFIGIFFFIASPYFVRAGSGQPVDTIKFNPAAINALPSDTIIPKKKVKTEEEKPATVIKIVPKARRQSIPVPVNVKVRPVKIIKPKIIKPVIKVIR
jgi:hypothetical protein